MCVAFFTFVSFVYDKKVQKKRSSNVFGELMRWNIRFKGGSKHQFRLPGIYHYGWDFHLLAIYPFLILLDFSFFCVSYSPVPKLVQWTILMHNDWAAKTNSIMWIRESVRTRANVCVSANFISVKASKKHKNGISVCWKIDFGRP